MTRWGHQGQDERVKGVDAEGKGFSELVCDGGGGREGGKGSGEWGQEKETRHRVIWKNGLMWVRKEWVEVTRERGIVNRGRSGLP